MSVLLDVDVEKELDAFCFFCERYLITQQGPALDVEPWQRTILRDHFAGTQVSVIITPKKLGKSTLISAVALYRALMTPECDVIVVAQSIAQAGILYRHMRGFIHRNPELQKHLDVKPGFNEIRCKRDLGRIRTMAADPANLEGVEPTTAIIDEYGKARSSEVYNILNDALGTRQGQLVVITNAASDDMSPLGQLRENAYDNYFKKREGAYRYCVKPDGTFALHEYALEPTDDVENLALVKTANPASWMTIEELKRRREDPGMTIQRWKRMACGIIVPDGETVIAAHEWDALEAPGFEIPKTASPVYVGWDQATRGVDKTALTPLWWRDDGHRIVGEPTIIDVPDDGPFDDRLVVDALRRYRDQFGQIIVVYDPNAGADILATQVERDHTGITCVEFPQHVSLLAKADLAFLTAIRQKQLIHSGKYTDQMKLLRSHVLNAVERKVGDGFMFDRPQHGPRKPTDGLRALSMAHWHASEQAKKPKKRSGAYFGSY